MADTNAFFDTDNYTALSRLTLARAEDVNAIVTSIVSGFDLLPTKVRQYEGRVTYCGDCAGSVNAETCTAPYTITLADGLHLRVRAAFTNTGALTLNPSSLGVVSVRKYDGTALAAGDWLAGAFYDVVYNSGGGVFRIVNPVVAITGGVTAFDIAGLTAESTVDDAADYEPFYDASAGVNRKKLATNDHTLMLKAQFFAGA